jgi:hypothetical protein
MGMGSTKQVNEMGMNFERRFETAKFSLNLVLGFFSRVETKISVVLAIDTAMLAVLTSNLPTPDRFQWRMAIGIVAVVLIARSYWCLFRAGFPNLEGGTTSLIYFREIAKRKEREFIIDFSEQTEEEHLTDVLRQVYRNSEILTQKFDYLKKAFVAMLWAIIPWIAALAFFVVRNSGQTHQMVK